MTKRRHSEDLLGAAALAVEATKRVTGIVEAMHREIASGPAWLGEPLAVPTRFLTALLYGNVRSTTSAVGFAVERAVKLLAPVLGESTPLEQLEILRAALNGVVGTHLHETRNPLAIPFSLRVVERAPKMLVMLHGSSMSDRGWRRRGHDHGAMLADHLGCGLAYACYNSGLHVSQNGALLLAALHAEEIVLVAHSMGGLVARSALHLGLENVRALVTLGTPHHGAALERAGAVLQTLMRISRYSAPLADLARVRGAGITDLRFGIVREEDWRDRDPWALGADPRTPLPLPRGVDGYAVAASLSAEGAPRPRGDGLVSVASALGESETPEMTLAFKAKRVVYETSHLGLLDSAIVAAQLADWLARPGAASPLGKRAPRSSG